MNRKTMKYQIARGAPVMLWLAILLITVSESTAQWTLDPKTYRSPSGDYELFVDPSDETGKGPGTYRMTHRGEIVWAREEPFTLREAKLLDDGTVAGYAYEGGVYNTGHHGLSYKGLHVVLFDSTGAVRLMDPSTSHETGKVPRDFSFSDSPSVNGLIIDIEHDRFIVSVALQSKDHPAAWWKYRLSNGEKLGDVYPAHPPKVKIGFSKEISAQPVPGTPFTLVHWYVFEVDGERQVDSAALYLVDKAGEAIWTHDITGEYDKLGERWSWWRDLVSPGIVQMEVGHKSVSFRSYRENARLQFSLESDPAAEHGWRVEEAGREAGVTPQPIQKENVVAVKEINAWPEVELEFVGEIALKTPEVAPVPFSQVLNFQFDSAGNLGFVGRNEADQPVFIRLDSEGTVLSKYALDGPDFEGGLISMTAAGRDDSWLLIKNTLNENRQMRAWWIDANTGERRPIEDLNVRDVDSVRSTPDGGFIMLASHHLEYTIQDEIMLFDAELKPHWNRREEGYGQGYSFEAVVPREDGGVVGLMVSGHKLVYLDSVGNHERTVVLDDILGAKPNYPSGLTPDSEGGLILHDFDGDPPIYRISAEGEVIAKFRPRFADGRTFRITGDVKSAPDGRLWTSDGHALLRLDEQGVVDRVLGRQPEEVALDEISAMTVDRRGRIYALDSRTANLFVFEFDGTLVFICNPDPTDFPTDGGSGKITVDRDGTIAYHTGDYIVGHEKGYLRFTTDGERLGFKKSRFNFISEEWLDQSNLERRWVLGYDTICLIDRDGELLKTIKRRPDNTWLRRVDKGAVAPDGSLAVISSHGGFGSNEAAKVSVYDADGNGVATWALTERSYVASLAFNGQIVCIVSEKHMRMYDAEGGPRGRFPLPRPGGEGEWWHSFISPEGNEVWLRNLNEKVLLRYRLP